MIELQQCVTYAVNGMRFIPSSYPDTDSNSRFLAHQPSYSRSSHRHRSRSNLIIWEPTARQFRITFEYNADVFRFQPPY